MAPHVRTCQHIGGEGHHLARSRQAAQYEDERATELSDSKLAETRSRSSGAGPAEEKPHAKDTHTIFEVMVGGRDPATRARKRRGMYTSNEEPGREFARWLGGPQEASLYETAYPRAKTLGN